MPHREQAPAGAPCWIELFTSDHERSRAFYADLFGWASEGPQEQFGGYFNFQKDGVMVAGGMPNDGSAGTPDQFTVYLAVDDIEAAVAAVPANGGTVISDAMAVMDLGSMAIVQDPGGAVVGFWQPGTHKGTQVLGEPGAPSWFELHTTAHAATVAFYEAVLGWKTTAVADSDEFRYSTAVFDGEELAGVMDASAYLGDGETAAGWQVYVSSADADADVARAVELGATVIEPPVDTPYGRLARLADPTGATFRLQQPPAS